MSSFSSSRRFPRLARIPTLFATAKPPLVWRSMTRTSGRTAVPQPAVLFDSASAMFSFRSLVLVPESFVL